MRAGGEGWGVGDRRLEILWTYWESWDELESDDQRIALDLNRARSIPTRNPHPTKEPLSHMEELGNVSRDSENTFSRKTTLSTGRVYLPWVPAHRVAGRDFIQTRSSLVHEDHVCREPLFLGSYGRRLQRITSHWHTPHSPPWFVSCGMNNI